MRLFFLITFLLVGYSARVQPLYSKEDSLTMLDHFTYGRDFWQVDSFSNISQHSSVSTRFAFLILWMYKNNLGRATNTRTRFVDQYGDLIESKTYKQVIIDADSCKSIFDILLPNTLNNDIQKNRKLVTPIAARIYNDVLGNDWSGDMLLISIKVKDQVLNAYIFKTKRGIDFEKIEIENSSSLAYLTSDNKSKVDQKKVRRVHWISTAIFGVLLGLLSSK